MLSAHSELKVRIEGNCDERGSGQYNLALGQRRADSAKKYLATLGVGSGQITAISFGAEKPKALGHDEEAIDVVFHASIADVVERHVKDERLRTALHGQGVIGTYAGPRDAGTAAVHLMHSMGTLEGTPGAWGYVQGGTGRVSFALAAAAEEAGATIATV